MLHGMYHDELDPGSAVIIGLLQELLVADKKCGRNTLPTPATMGHYKKNLQTDLYLKKNQPMQK